MRVSYYFGGPKRGASLENYPTVLFTHNKEPRKRILEAIPASIVKLRVLQSLAVASQVRCRGVQFVFNMVHFSICACHPCAEAMLIFSVSFQFYRMIPEGISGFRVPY